MKPKNLKLIILCLKSDRFYRFWDESAPKEELAEQGQKLYESGIRQQVEAGNKGKIVAIC